MNVERIDNDVLDVFKKIHILNHYQVFNLYR